MADYQSVLGMILFQIISLEIMIWNHFCDLLISIWNYFPTDEFDFDLQSILKRFWFWLHTKIKITCSKLIMYEYNEIHNERRRKKKDILFLCNSTSSRHEKCIMHGYNA